MRTILLFLSCSDMCWSTFSICTLNLLKSYSTVRYAVLFINSFSMDIFGCFKLFDLTNNIIRKTVFMSYHMYESISV